MNEITQDMGLAQDKDDQRASQLRQDWNKNIEVRLQILIISYAYTCLTTSTGTGLKKNGN